MPAPTSDSWNNPQIPPPPPSPAVVGARFRDTSPTADPDYEARYPEPPVSRDETGSPTSAGPSPISRQPSISKSHHRSESTSKAPHKKKRGRVPSGGVGVGREGVEEPTTPRQSRSHGQQHPASASQYTNAPLNYYPPPQYQHSVEAMNGNSNGGGHSRSGTGGYPGPGYYHNGYGGGLGTSYSPSPMPPPPSHIYPPPPRVDYESAYYGSSYPPAHHPHPLPTPPLGTNGKPESFAFVETAATHSSKTVNGTQTGLNREYYENGNGAKTEGAQPMKSTNSSQESKDGEEKEAKKQVEGEGPPESPLESKVDQIPLVVMPYFSPPPRSPVLPPPQYRPTGYPFLAQTLSTTPSLQLYRRFSALNHLVLLHLQDEISELENVLSELDEQEYIINGGAGLRARRGMGTGSRRLQVMGAIAFKLQQYNKALKGYRDMNEVLEPAGEDDMTRYKEWMEKSRPLVEAEGRVLIDHPDDLACLHRKADSKEISNDIGSWGGGAWKSRKHSSTGAMEVPFSPAFKLGLTALSCGIAGLARWRVAQTTGAGIEVPLALVAGATGGVAAMMWAFF